MQNFGINFGLQIRRAADKLSSAISIAGSYLYDGSDDYTTHGNILDYTSGDFSFSFWVKPVSVAGVVIPVWKGAFNTNGYYFQFAGARLDVITSQAAAFQITSSAESLLTTDWQLITIVREGTAIRLYQNGSEMAYSAQGTHTSPATSSSDFEIGRIGAPTNLYNGYLTQFRSYSRILTTAEITNLYNNVEISTVGLELQLNCDETAGTTAIDYSGNGRDGTNTNITEGTFYTTVVPT